MTPTRWSPPHYSRKIRNYLDITFGQQWDGCGGLVHWPVRSPKISLSCIDFYHMKTLVNYNPIDSVWELVGIIAVDAREI